MFRSIRYALAALLLVPAAAEARVDYAIDLTSPEHHLGQVSATFPVTSTPYLDVKMPAWRSGRYTILDLLDDLGWLDKGIAALLSKDGFWGRRSKVEARQTASA